MARRSKYTRPTKEHWFRGLTGGMNQSVDSALVEGNESPLLKNITLDEIGNWGTRAGTDRVGDRITATDRVWGLVGYNSTDGSTRYLMMITERDLYRLNEGTNAFDSQDTDEWTVSTRVDGVNFLNRLYLGEDSGDVALAYTTGGAITDVAPKIGGAMMDVNKEILMVGGNTIKPNVLFHTDPFTDTFYSVTGTCGADADTAGANTITATAATFDPKDVGGMIYNTTDGTMNLIVSYTSTTVVTTDTATSTWDNDTFYVLRNNVKIDGKCTGIIRFQENFVVFDEDTLYLIDPVSNLYRTIRNFGCVNYRSIQVVNGILIWANREGLYAFNGSELPVCISKKIRDRKNGYGVWDLINDSNWGQIASGVLPAEGIYKLSVGDLSTQSGAPASAITNAEIEYDMTRATLTLNSLQDEPVVYANFINTNGASDLYVGCKGTSSVYKVKTGTVDDNSAGTAQDISFDFRTPHLELGDPRYASKIKKTWIKYISDNEVTVEISINRGSYETFETLSASSTVKVQEIKARVDQWGFSHSLKFTGTDNFVLEAYGFLVEIGSTTRIPVT